MSKKEMGIQVQELKEFLQNLSELSENMAENMKMSGSGVKLDHDKINAITNEAIKISESFAIIKEIMLNMKILKD